MDKTKNKNVTITMSDEVKDKGLSIANVVFSSSNLSATISYLINKEFENLTHK